MKRPPRLAAYPALTLFLLMVLTHAGGAGDAAARRVLGFSPDGAVFAFEQYSLAYDDDAAFSEYQFIDTRTDRFLPDTPIRVFLRGDEALDETKARADAAKRAEPLIAKHRIGEPGSRYAARPSMGLDEVGVYQMASTPLDRRLALALPDGRDAELTVAERPLGSVDCIGAGGRGTPGRVEVRGLILALAVAGARLLLNDDRTLPPARRCASAYGIAEAFLHVAPDRTQTLAVLLELVDNHDYRAGPNRRFMAVTRRLPVHAAVR